MVIIVLLQYNLLWNKQFVKRRRLDSLKSIWVPWWTRQIIVQIRPSRFSHSERADTIALKNLRLGNETSVVWCNFKRALSVNTSWYFFKIINNYRQDREQTVGRRDKWNLHFPLDSLWFRSWKFIEGSTAEWSKRKTMTRHHQFGMMDDVTYQENFARGQLTWPSSTHLTVRLRYMYVCMMQTGPDWGWNELRSVGPWRGKHQL